MHINLIEEKPVTPAIDIQSIVTKEGKLFPYHSVLVKKIVLKHSQTDQVCTEVENQIQRCTSAGIQLTHVDGHQHLHTFPPIFKAIQLTLEKYNITKMRYLNPPWFEMEFKQLFKINVGLFFKLYNLFIKNNYKHPDYFIGFLTVVISIR